MGESQYKTNKALIGLERFDNVQTERLIFECEELVPLADPFDGSV